MKKRELATVANCFVCDSFFIIVVDTISPASSYSGRKGTVQFENDLEKIQLEHFDASFLASGKALGVRNENNEFEKQFDFEFEAFRLNSDTDSTTETSESEPKNVLKCKVRKGDKCKQKHNNIQNITNNTTKTNEKLVSKNNSRVVFLPCPTCAECLSGLHYMEYLDSECCAVLSPCIYYSFDVDELPPLYMDIQANTDKKPKWNLVSGLGPQTLELDSSRSGRIYKPFLKTFINPSISVKNKKNASINANLNASRYMPFGRYITDVLGYVNEIDSNDTKTNKTFVNAKTNATDFSVDFANCHEKLSKFWEMLCVCDMCGRDRYKIQSDVDVGDVSPCIEHYDYNQNRMREGNFNSGKFGEVPNHILHFVTTDVYTSYIEMCNAHAPAFHPEHWRFILPLLRKHGIVS